jgi:hypothetical protein
MSAKPEGSQPNPRLRRHVLGGPGRAQGGRRWHGSSASAGAGSSSSSPDLSREIVRRLMRRPDMIERGLTLSNLHDKIETEGSPVEMQQLLFERLWPEVRWAFMLDYLRHGKLGKALGVEAANAVYALAREGRTTLARWIREDDDGGDWRDNSDDDYTDPYPFGEPAYSNE